MSQLDAADALGMSDRTFRRWSRRFEDEGEAGLVDRRLGRRSGRAAPDDAADEVERLYREMYPGFTAKHFHEHLRRDHGFAWGYTLGSSPRAGSGPRATCRGAGCSPRRRGVGHTGASGRAGR